MLYPKDSRILGCGGTLSGGACCIVVLDRSRSTEERYKLYRTELSSAGVVSKAGFVVYRCCKPQGGVGLVC